MTFPLLVLLGQKAAIDPRIAQTWTVAAAEGIESATLRLGQDGRFEMRSVSRGEKPQTIRGRYTVGPAPQGAPAKMAKAKQLRFFYDLASLKAVGMSQAQVDALARRGKKDDLGMQLYFVSEVPMLTDVLTAHFVPVKGKEAALRRLAVWKPF